ncbi:MAG TPA: phage tail tape measure protein [Microbacterium sp.]|nr:phage tail tape measure protein [Microbacterium sp.]
MAKLTVADLEVLFTANTTQVEKAEKQIVAVGKKVESKPIQVDANAKPALDSMDRVEDAARKLVSKDTALKLDADISRAEKSLERTKQRLEDLQVRALGGLDVGADVKRAEAQLARTQRTLDGLVKAKNEIQVEVDEQKAESGLKRLVSLFKRKSEEAGDEGGRSLSKNLDAATRGAGEKVGEVVGGDIENTLVDALSAIPIAGGIILAGVAIGKAITGAINDGLQVDARQDRLQALTGISAADALRLGRAAGEAYANNFGESIETNMDTARLALQFRILDPKATTRDAQLVVQGLAGIADVLGEDVRPVAQAVTQLLSTGLAKNAQGAYDIIAAGARNGLNRNEDLIDTLTEYPSLFKRLGLSGEEALGLINQGMQAGARNSDLAADALKEFQIRATDASVSSAAGFKALGLNAQDMTAQIARGGEDARNGLALVLDKLRETEDPVKRNAAAVALFGTQAEDLGDALFAMDLSNAVDQLDGVAGSAQRMFDQLGDNTAAKVEKAQRSIETAADGIKGALAVAFADPLGDFADWVSKNRGPVLQFFSDLINGAIDFAITANTGFGEFVSGPLAAMVKGLSSVIGFFDHDAGTKIEAFANEMETFSDSTDVVNDSLEKMRGKFNGFADGQVALGYLSDASMRTVDAITRVGVAADGTKLSLGGVDTSFLAASESGAKLKAQLEAAGQAFEDEIGLAREAGESQQNLTDRYNTTRQALLDQMVAMGLTQEQAQSLIDTVLKTPEQMETEFKSNADAEKGKVIDLGTKIITLPDGSSTISVDTAGAQGKIDRFISLNNGKVVKVYVDAEGRQSYKIGGKTISAQADGGIVMPMASGGSLTPMAPRAQAVPPNTWRVVGDRMRDREFYIPDDGSAQSMSVLLEAMRSFGVLPMADGGVVGAAGPGGQQLVVYVQSPFTGDYLIAQVADIADARVAGAFPSAESVRSDLPFG